MIIRPRPSLLQLFFIVRGSVIVRILPQMIVIFLLSVAIVWGHEARPGVFLSLNGAPFALLGIALSIFLGFRNNACYDRWWEARRNWGQLVYVARGFARQMLVLEAAHGEEGRVKRRELLNMTIAFGHALVGHLRPGGVEEKVVRHLEAGIIDLYRATRNPPDLLLRLLSADLARLRAEGRITDIQYQMLDASVGQMGAVQAACERIRNTPLPFGYTLLLHRTAYLFCFLLPFGLADSMGLWTPLIAVIVSYTFFGLDALGDELVAPFGTTQNSLPVMAICRTIEINILEDLGETELPAVPKPKDFVLA